MKLIFDKTFAIFLLVCFSLPLLIVSLLVLILSPGPILYWSKRVGKDNKHFFMPKFRTMKTNTPQKATHLLKNPNIYLIPAGNFFRRYSIDELPQLFSVLAGKMSFVGPRPALYNQIDLIELRKKYFIDSLKPGITGWAQINGRDNLSIPEKVMLDNEYRLKKSFIFDIYIILMTILRVFFKTDISH